MELFKHLPEEEDGRKEWLHQQDCFSYVSLHYPHLTFFHVSNETGTKSSAGFIDKRTRAGVRKGVSDNIILDRPVCGNYLFTAFELKRPSKKEKAKPEQMEFGEEIESKGGLFVICWGHLAFRRFLQKYY